MAETPDSQKSRYPLMAYNYRVSIGEETIGFSEVSGLQREYETLTYRHGLSYQEGEVLVRYWVDKFAPITLKRGTLRGASKLYSWLEDSSGGSKPPERSLTISLCDEAGSPVVNWFVARAIPVKFEASSFDASSNEVFIETLEIMARGVELKA